MRSTAATNPEASLVANLACFTASDIQKTAGLSYRQLNDWDAKGAVTSNRTNSEGWRKFTAREVFALGVCAEVRRQFGVPLPALVALRRYILDGKSDHSQIARHGVVTHGASVWLMSDLKRVFAIEVTTGRPAVNENLSRCNTTDALLIVNVTRVVKLLVRCQNARQARKSKQRAVPLSVNRTHKPRKEAAESEAKRISRVPKNVGQLDSRPASEERCPDVTGQNSELVSVRPITSRTKRPFRGARPRFGAFKERT